LWVARFLRMMNRRGEGKEFVQSRKEVLREQRAERLAEG